MEKLNAYIVEIFSSRQGEGLYVGQPMTFVRFGSCDMNCRYCDTTQAFGVHDELRVERSPGSEEFESVENPVSATKLCELLERFDDEVVSITGGEPLEQAGFLAEWLPAVAARKRVLLETNGVRYAELDAILPHVHIVSMDIKLPSATGRAQRWADHSEFLKKVVAAGREVYAKFVVTADTTDQDLEEAIAIVSKVNKYTPIIIQPAGETLTFHHPVTKKRLKAVERLCSAYLEDVRVIPQMHKEWGVL